MESSTPPRDTAWAMSQEKVEIVRRAFEIVQEGVRRRDPGAAFDKALREGVIVSNLEWRAGGRGGVALAGMEDALGREGFVGFMRGWTEDFEDLDVQLEEVIEVDDERVVAITGWDGLGKGSRARVKMRTAWSARSKQVASCVRSSSSSRTMHSKPPGCGSRRRCFGRKAQLCSRPVRRRGQAGSVDVEVSQPAVAGASGAGGGPKRFSPASPCWRQKTSSTIHPISGISQINTHQPVRSVS
jgi:hypothetical protein